MESPAEASVYPVFLKLEGRAVLVVGGGPVAERKIRSLLDVRARVRVVAPEATDDVQRLAREGVIDWDARTFDDGDVNDVWLVIAATSDADVQRRVATAGAARRTFVMAVDDPPNASAYAGAVVRRTPFVVGISSSGATPALTRLIREVIELALPSDAWVEHAKRLRAKWIAEGTPMGDRFAELVRELGERTR